ncbi:DUF3862 domain-containing protein [Alteromonas genovensis]|jgi:hypothetical protein|uniref:DUF3862 domain-containing protein n=1 Tax=Alteromonas genovensis TaxID=471225 RepID=A0A6N9TFW3_9ALTE|nr:DUF3862 domain-containing protein [Alteromonas genovensis]NDW14945.1 DUF3862 domain-containing protein [Alteromonas genovensis]
MKLKTIALVVGMLALTACSKLSKENYDSLEMGMTQKEVESIIGSADKCGKTMGTMACTWGNEESSYIKIVFMADKAVTFNYSGLK